MKTLIDTISSENSGLVIQSGKGQIPSKSRKAKPLEKRTNSEANRIFPALPIVNPKDSLVHLEAKKIAPPAKMAAIQPVSSTPKQKPIDLPQREERKSRSEKMLDKLEENEELSLRELMFQIGLLQTSITADLERLLGAHFLNMIDRNQEQNDALVAEQRSKKAAFFMVLGGVVSLIGAGLGAADATGTAIPMIDKMMPAMLKSGKVLEQAGLLTGKGGDIVSNFSHAEQQKLRHLYEMSKDRMKELERVRNMAGQEKKQTLQRQIEAEQTYQRLVQELLSRQS